MVAAFLEGTGISKRFGGLQVLNDVGFRVAEGEIVALIGPNGAGKTTLFNLINGLQRPSAGVIRVGGERVGTLPAHRIARLGVARTFQTPRVFRDMSAEDNVRFGLEFAGRRRRHARDAFDNPAAILDLLGLGDAAAIPAGGLTPAKQRLLEIGMALGARPRVLLLDEVAAGLTHAEVDATAQLIRRVRDETGLAVIWIEHAVRVLMNYVERVAVLHQGAKIADGDPRKVVKEPAVVEAYLGEEMAA